MSKYDVLKLDNQLCFPLYAVSKEIVRKYTPLLDELNLTYTQYITMMVLWEVEEISVKELGNRLYLDSGTLTPLLKNLEKKGYVTRNRSEKDERVLVVKASPIGMKLRDKAVEVPKAISGCVDLTEEEAIFLYRIVHKMLDQLD